MSPRLLSACSESVGRTSSGWTPSQRKSRTLGGNGGYLIQQLGKQVCCGGGPRGSTRILRQVRGGAQCSCIMHHGRCGLYSRRSARGRRRGVCRGVWARGILYLNFILPQGKSGSRAVWLVAYCVLERNPGSGTAICASIRVRLIATPLAAVTRKSVCTT